MEKQLSQKEKVVFIVLFIFTTIVIVVTTYFKFFWHSYEGFTLHIIPFLFRICACVFLVLIFTRKRKAKPKAPKQKNMVNILDSLEKIAALKEQGILTEEEFEAKKQELMSQM